MRSSSVQPALANATFGAPDVRDEVADDDARRRSRGRPSSACRPCATCGCSIGPSSRICWPIPRVRSTRIRNGVPKIATKNAAPAAMSIAITIASRRRRSADRLGDERVGHGLQAHGPARLDEHRVARLERVARRTSAARRVGVGARCAPCVPRRRPARRVGDLGAAARRRRRARRCRARGTSRADRRVRVGAVVAELAHVAEHRDPLARRRRAARAPAAPLPSRSGSRCRRRSAR